MNRLGTLSTVDGRSVLRFERRLAHPVEKVWRAITEPAELAKWFPARFEAEIEVGAPIRFVFEHDEGPTLTGVIAELDPPHVFAYTWDTDVLHLELHPEQNGCLLVFTYTFDDRPGAASFAAGWDTCLEALERVALDGKPAAELSPRWPKLHEEYMERFGLAEGTVHRTDAGWTVRFDRQLAHPVDINQVWALLTEADESAPVPSAPAPGDPPPLRFTNGYVPAGTVTAVDPPKLLEYRWLFENKPVGRVRWELSNSPSGARVVLTQTIPSELKDQRITALAAWHTHLELLALHLSGQSGCWPEQRTEELMRHYSSIID